MTTKVKIEIVEMHLPVVVEELHIDGTIGQAQTLSEIGASAEGYVHSDRMLRVRGEMTEAALRWVLTNPSALELYVAIAIAALKRIAACEDAPDIDAVGEWRFGLHCGVEDRDCQDRYDGADYGHAVGVEKGLEWASNEAKTALKALGQNA